MFPTLENIAVNLQDTQSKHEHRMSTLEDRKNRFESNAKMEIQSNISNMKEGMLNELKPDINTLVDNRSRELEDRKRRELNITLFNLKEHNNAAGIDYKREDEEDFVNICSCLGLNNVQLTTTFRLGKKGNTSRPRPLKVILINKADRKFLLNNAKFIKDKAPAKFREVIITKDMTPQQRVERRTYVQSLRGRRGQNTETQNPRNVSGRVVSPPLPLNAVTQHFSVQRELSPVLSAEADMPQVNEMEVQESTVFQFSQPYDDKTVLDGQTIIGGIPMPQHQSTVLEVQPQPEVNG